ncbi:hypothetical protein [Caldimonas brevitalea]|uniref:Uncharacterized protein n=1 Tax=Caldimonas brevitalea TaxID=413882 RepID=A0A0G3BL87_9BURK|nr:hypothetical protein [Caldimonas brevitalea]AKJ28758.1 hypothetical protein AAW51_2067 [Caldimonas brevitalea]
MSQFSLEDFTAVTVTGVNVRAEHHGPDQVPAADIKFELTTSNNILSEFDGALKSMLYKRDEEADRQAYVDGVEPVTDLPLLRTSILEPLKLKKEYAGYTLTVDQGISDTSCIELGQCEVNNFVVDCKEGGSVTLKFRVQASGLQPSVLGKVASLIGREVEITLLPPNEVGEPGAAIDASSDGDWFGTKDATDTFLEAQS